MTAPLATIRTQDDLIEALRTAKALRGLSNEFCDVRAGLTRGHVDKAIGPSRARSLSPMLFETLLSLFAVKLIMVPDEDNEAAMREKWEGRDTSNVRVSHRVSQQIVDRAKPYVLRACGAQGQAVRHSKLSPEHRSEIARKAADALWKKRGRKRTRKAAKKRAWYRKTMEERLKERLGA